MSEESLDFVESSAALDKPGGKGVPETVEPELIILDSGLSYIPLEEMCDPAPLQWPSIQSEHMLALELPAELGEQIIQAAARPL